MTVITREVFAEAVTLGRQFLPRLTAIELAQVLGISPVHMLRCLVANKDHIQLDGEKNIVGFAKAGAEMTMSTIELWKWHVQHNAGGVESKALPAKSQADLSKMVQGKTNFVKTFDYVICAFLTEEREGGNVKNQIGALHGNDIAAHAVLVAEVKGQGTVIDKYLYAIPVDATSAPAIRAAGLKPFVAEHVMKQMSSNLSWSDYTVPEEKTEWQRMVVEMNVDGIPADVLKPADAQPATSAIEKTPPVGAPVVAPAEDEGKKRSRRTKEQLLADRQKLVTVAMSAGITQEVAEKAILTPEKQGDAEKAYEALIADLKKAPAAPATPAAMDTAALLAAAPKSTPSFATPTVQDLKASIRENASAPAPVTPVAAIAAHAAVAAAPAAISGAGHVGPAPVAPTAPAAPAPTTSAMASTLLDSLLSSTGQKAG